MTETPLPASPRFVDLSPAAGTTSLDYNFELTRSDGLTVLRYRSDVTTTLLEGVDYTFPPGLGDNTGGSILLSSPSLASNRYVLLGLYRSAFPISFSSGRFQLQR